MGIGTISKGHKKSTVKRPAYRPIARLGEMQRLALRGLDKNDAVPVTAVEIRGLIGKPPNDHGTRATHAILKRLVEAV